MSQQMHNYLTDPKTGKPYTRAERLARLDKPFADQKIITDVPSGTPAERQQQRHATSLLQQEIAQQIAEQAKADRPAVNPYAGRIADLEAELQWAIPTVRPGLELRLSALKKAAAEWEADRAKAERRATFEASPDYQRIREHHDAFLASREVSHPDLAESDILMLRAVATSDAYDSPAAQAKAYFEAVTKIETLQASREAERLATAEQVAAKAATEYAAQKQRTDAANERLAELGGGPSE